jgi:hypothetical protein
MSYYDISEHWLTYTVVAAGVLFVLGLTAATLRRALRYARKIGYTRAQLWRIVKISISFTLVPALSVLVGFLLLAPMLGVPLSWWRLSIIGNTAYEIMAAGMALSAAGVSTTPPQADGEAFILVMYVMAIGIMGSLLLAPLLAGRIHRGTFRIREQDWKWSALSSGIYLSTILVVFVVPMFFDFSAALLTLMTSAALMFFFKWLILRFRLAWLSGFSFTISTFAAIALSVLWTRALGV